MKIGIDFDNTIVNHDKSFNKAYLDLKHKIEITNSVKDKKSLLKKYLTNKEWIDVQEKVYAKYINEYSKLNNGFKLFLNRCKVLGCEIEIVSHKTKLSLNKKLNLIKPANAFLKSRFEVDKIFFFESLQEKLNHINNSNYDYFIDDLEAVIEEINLPIKNKILFNFNLPNSGKNFTVFYSWREITKHILKNPKDLEILLYVKKQFNNNNFRIVKKFSSTNSNVYNIRFLNDYNFKVKVSKISKVRITEEYNKLKILHKYLPNFHPTPVKIDLTYNLSICEWVDGSILNNFNKSNIDKIINYLMFLNSKIIKKTKLSSINASSACFSYSDIFNQLNIRLNQYQKNSDMKILNYISKLNNYILELKENLPLNYKNEFPKKNLIISPSDLSLKNFILSKNNNLYYIDHEYLGLDDNIKLICDTILHPANSFKKSSIKYFLNNFDLKISKIDILRFKKLIHFYGIIWCLIILNPLKNKNCPKENKIHILKKSKILFYKIKKKYTNEYLDEITNFS